MSGRDQGPYDAIARKWLALVERRQENFIDLCNTGRWRHYYTKAEFLDEMRKVLHLRNRWAALSGEPVQGEDALQLENIQTPHRLLPDRLVSLGSDEGDSSAPETDLAPVRRRVNERVHDLLATHWPD